MGHNFPKHRYKHGKQKKGIDLADFSRMLQKAEELLHPKYDSLTVKSFLVVLYWTGLRKTEVHGARRHKYVLPPTKGPGHKDPLTRYTDPVPGILKEDITLTGDTVFIRAIARKKGKREAPLELWTGFPYVSLIVEQWQRTPKTQRVWPITEWDSWNLMKQIDGKKYPHFFRFNRITELCADPKMSVADVCSWTGLTPQTINEYMERSGRFIHETARKMKAHYETTSTKKMDVIER